MGYGEMFGFAVGVIGLSPSSFYALTPAEFVDISKQYSEAERIKFDTFGMAIYNATGLMLNGKKYTSIFSKEDDSPKYQKGSLEEREKTLSYFKEKFNIQGGE